MLTREEYKKIVARIFDKIRGDHEEYKGDSYCNGIADCSKCPFTGTDMLCLSGDSIDNIFNAFEYAERWAKEHPIVTYEQKYEETFGVKPINDSGEYICPSYLGFKPCKYLCGNGSPCVKCAKDFWQSEYKPPKKEG